MDTSWADNFIPVVPVEDDLVHTNHYPFCFDLTCGCHEDQALIQIVREHVTNGLMTPDEATNFVAGNLL